MASEREKTADEIRQIEERLRQLEEQIERTEERETRQENMYADLLESCKREIADRLSDLEQQFRATSEERINDLAENYRTRAQQEAIDRQTVILRTNKIFRDLARKLGVAWKEVLERLLATLSPPLDEAEQAATVVAIEAEKPYIRAYKALLAWKGLAGDNLNMMDLVEALDAYNLKDLAQATLRTLSSDGEALLSIGEVGRGVNPGAPSEEASGGASSGHDLATATADEAFASGGGGDRPDEDSSSRPVQNVPAKGREGEQTVAQEVPVSVQVTDSRLLRLAKKTNDVWHALAERLRLSDADIAEIDSQEGSGTYQGAFKMLFRWRELCQVPNSDHVRVLIMALHSLERTDLADEVAEWITLAP